MSKKSDHSNTKKHKNYTKEKDSDLKTTWKMH